MNKNDVPQDHNSSFEGGTKGIYALDDEGNYVLQSSNGWEAEQVVLDVALDQYRQLADRAWEQANSGLVSPLEFHMFSKRMDHKQLAQSSGVWLWRVRRHCKAKKFEVLPHSMKNKYAQTLGLTMEQLAVLPPRLATS